MKKTVLTLSVIALTLVGCKKNYTCECEYYYENFTETRKEEFKSKPKHAEMLCTEGAGIYSKEYHGDNFKCQLK